MSALPPKADIRRRNCNVRFVPKADLREVYLSGPPIRISKGRRWPLARRKSRRARDYLTTTSRKQRLELWVLTYEFKILHPTIQAPHMTGLLDNQIDQDACVDDVIVNDKVVGVLDEGPVHMGKPVDAHQ